MADRVWPDYPADDDVEMRQALDRAESAVQRLLGVGYPAEYMRAEGVGSIKVSHIIQVAVEAAMRDDHGIQQSGRGQS